MTIYKVSYFVKREILRGKNAGNYEDVEHREEIIVDNFETVCNRYKYFKNQWDCGIMYAYHFGNVLAFIPKVFDDGMLANYPDNDEYIGRAYKDKGGEIIEQPLMDAKFFQKGA